MRVLVSGGAGYIGSHTVVQLIGAGHDVVIADSFVNAKPSVIARLESLTGARIPVFRVDLADAAATDQLFAQTPVEAVVHFAGLKGVGESVEQPLRYYRNNLDATLALLDAMRRHGGRLFVFSSSATVYGAEAPLPYHETYEPLVANDPYSRTKLMGEQVLRDSAAADPHLRVAILRYFNPVGAHPSGQLGEDPQGVPNNLMPYVAQVAVGRRERLSVFGGDYDTADGTAERDYIHVEDLAAGHSVVLDRIANHEDSVSTWNLGSGVPSSVLEVVAAFERASGRGIPYDIVGRRPGDLPQTWADPAKAAAELGWRTSRSLDDMCADAWRWQSRNPQGYPG